MNTGKITLKIKKKQCAKCQYADKHSLKIGTAHCREILAGTVNIVNGVCKTEAKEG